MSAAQLAIEEIRDLIESGALAPGARINAEELAESLGISRTPVRDALQTLRTEGLVEIFPRRGIFVRRISKQEVQDVYAIKTAIEPLAAAWAAERGSEADRQTLAALLQQLQAAGAEEDVFACARVVDTIHTHLFSMAESEVLSDVYRVFQTRVKLLRHLNMGQPGRLKVSIDQHSSVVNHVVNREPEAAQKIMQQHMVDASESVQNIVV